MAKEYCRSRLTLSIASWRCERKSARDAAETSSVAHRLEHLELYATLRLRGELGLNLGETMPAEVDFSAAIALAQKIGAKGWELRAAMSLAC